MQVQVADSAFTTPSLPSSCSSSEADEVGSQFLRAVMRPLDLKIIVRSLWHQLPVLQLADRQYIVWR